MSEIAQYQGFLDRWREEIRNPRIQQQSKFIDAFSRFRDEYLKLKTETERISLIKAPGFNIFKLLGVSRDEIKNSTFLANLLDPYESHGQGKLFLISFLNYCSMRYPDFPVTSHEVFKGHWTIVPEMGIETGRLDISIMNANTGSLILIENKVEAREQPDQLTRYMSWMENMKRDFPLQALIFLTRSGYEASTSGGRKYYRFSYHQDIPSWLEPVIDQIQAPAVREVVLQYIEIVHIF